FEAMGWLNYICSSHTIYPRLVKMFYANLATSTTCIANSFVLGTPICITPDIVAETLGIPNEGITNFHDIGKTEALGICLEQSNVNRLMNVTSSHLPIAYRIILLLVTNTFLPKEGSHTLPFERDLKFIACVKNGTQINLPYLIVNHLLSRPNHNPYPMLLSMIISTVLASFNIDIPDDEQSVKPSHKHLVNKGGLRQCGIVFEDGEWVKMHGRGREQAREPDRSSMALQPIHPQNNIKIIHIHRKKIHITNPIIENNRASIKTLRYHNRCPHSGRKNQSRIKQL
ncbi:hypothetical protein CFOL_v3_35754, partial [Cephalotus follicularis]